MRLPPLLLALLLAGCVGGEPASQVEAAAVAPAAVAPAAPLLVEGSVYVVGPVACFDEALNGCVGWGGPEPARMPVAAPTAEGALVATWPSSPGLGPLRITVSSASGEVASGEGESPLEVLLPALDAATYEVSARPATGVVASSLNVSWAYEAPLR